jgi:hypothetical protein
LFILGAVLLFFSSFIYLQTRERINLVQKDFDSNKQQLSDQIPLESPTDKKLEDTIIKTNPPKVVVNDREREIWCEQRDYEDLSSHPIFSKFNEWSEQFISLQCTDPLSCQDHDPRFVSHLIHKGKKLAQERSTILHKIIRGDPRKALELAFSQELLDFLPPEISEHMEVWETDFVDIVSIHRCFDPLHPNGWISRHAKFSDGRELRAWTYGRRKNLPSAKGISVWGIVLGEDFAVSENDAQVINYSAQSGIVRIAKKDISYETLAERNFVLDRLQPGKRRVKGITSYHYPLIMGSGMTAEKMLEMKYELNSTRVTFQDALNAAMAKNGKLLQIDDADESELLTEYLKNKYEEGNLTLGLTGSGDPVTFLWLGATDNEDTNGTLFDVDQNLTTQTLEINASEGDWKWLSGDPWNSSYAPWMADSTPSDNATKDFAAFDWNHSEGAGSWTDMNENATLPFIIEYDTQMASQQSDLKGIRKILVIPARFLDESTHYLSALGGSNQLITNELGEVILEEYQQDSPTNPLLKMRLMRQWQKLSAFTPETLMVSFNLCLSSPQL